MASSIGGEPQAALDDLRTALDDGVPGNEQTGQPELLAATHAVNAAWGIAAGLQLRGEALLLQAAETHGRSTFVLAQRATLPAAVRDLIAQAEACLTEALNRWHKLKDPARKNANFRHPKTGKQYNYRAETHRADDGTRGRRADKLSTRQAAKQQPRHKPTLRNQRLRPRLPNTTRSSAIATRSPTSRSRAICCNARKPQASRLLLTNATSIPVATFLKEMERCIKESRYTLVVMVPPRYLESGNCAEEAIICKVLDMAERRRRIIPLVIETVTMLASISTTSWASTSPIQTPLWSRTRSSSQNSKLSR
ncbi:MAG: toll/interleukin-1 receptor domain-containing protein [Acidobacteriota bacterium]